MEISNASETITGYTIQISAKQNLCVVVNSASGYNNISFGVYANPAIKDDKWHAKAIKWNKENKTDPIFE